MRTATLALLATLVAQDAGPAGSARAVASLLDGLAALDGPCRFSYREEELAWFYESAPGPADQEWIDAIAGWLDVARSRTSLEPQELSAFFEQCWSAPAGQRPGWERSVRRLEIELDGCGGLLQTDTGRDRPETWRVRGDLVLDYDARLSRLMALDPPVPVRLYDVDTILGPLFASAPRRAEMAALPWSVEPADPLSILAVERSPGQRDGEPPAGLWRVRFESAGGLPRMALRSAGEAARTLALYRYAPATDGRRWLSEVCYLTWFANSEVSIARRRLSNVAFDVRPADLVVVVPPGTVFQDRRAGRVGSRGDDPADWPPEVRSAVEVLAPGSPAERR